MSGTSYEDTIRSGAWQYRDVLDALTGAGLDGKFTQTGGMCAAIQVELDDGYYVLVTDKDDALPWARADHEGWLVGLYEPEERRTIDGPVRWRADPDGSPAKAVELVTSVLSDWAVQP